MGVLTGSEITDLRILLIAGKAHTKHTEGGDFRQATYRAIRQGLRSGKVFCLSRGFPIDWKCRQKISAGQCQISPE